MVSDHWQLVSLNSPVAKEQAEQTQDAYQKCLGSLGQNLLLVATGMGLKNDKSDGSILEFRGYPVIGNQSDMQTSGSCLTAGNDEEQLDKAFPRDPRIKGLFYHQTTVSVPLDTADVKKLRDLDQISLCGTELYNGFFTRFVRNSTAYLGKNADSVDVDITYYRSRDPTVPRMYEDVLEEIEQMALFKYKGMPHWGKNRKIGFLGIRIREKLGSKADQFVAVMEKYDPEGPFLSDWTDAVLGLRGKSLVIEGKRCALEGLCICSIDDHCAPEKGYLCKPGVVYPEARVCRKSIIP